MRLIDTDKLKVDYIVPSTSTNTSCYQYVSKEQIDNAPTIDPVRHGKWVSVPHKKARICSMCECDEPYNFADEDANVFDYCPHCGTKMDAKEVWTYFD